MPVAVIPDPEPVERHSTIPCSAVESSPARLVSLSDVIRHLELIWRLPPHSTGALVYRHEGRHEGTVHVEDGRVCWAVSSAMRRRLTDILRFQTSPPMSRESLEEIYRECLSRNVPLGETLVARGATTRRGLRAALRQHNAEAIALLGAASLEPSWQPRTTTKYDARFTFSTVDLLASVGALRDESSARRARRRLHQVVVAPAAGLAFLVRADGVPLPIGAVAAESFGPEEVASLGQWAVTTFGHAQKASPRGQLVASVLENGESAIVWDEARVTYVVLCADRATMARVMSRNRSASSE